MRSLATAVLMIAGLVNASKTTQWHQESSVLESVPRVLVQRLTAANLAQIAPKHQQRGPVTSVASSEESHDGPESVTSYASEFLLRKSPQRSDTSIASHSRM